MYHDVIEAAALGAEKKKHLLDTRPMAAFVHAMMAGGYIGLSIVLVLMLGTPLFAAHSPFLPLVMGASFGIALALVMLCGSDLFTGNTGNIFAGAVFMALGYYYVSDPATNK